MVAEQLVTVKNSQYMGWLGVSCISICWTEVLFKLYYKPKKLDSKTIILNIR